MSETSATAILYSASYGAQRVVWIFDSNPQFHEIKTYARRENVAIELEGLDVGTQGLVLHRGCSSGTLVTDAVEAPAFDWLVPWWNADVAGQGTLDVFLQTEKAEGWSRWYAMGSWSKTAMSFPDGDDDAVVETDTLSLKQPSARYRLKLVLSSGKNGDDVGAVAVHRCGVLSRSTQVVRPPTRRYILQESMNKVPPRSQMVEAEPIRGRICSPTCAAMALEALGQKMPTAFVAADCYDSGKKIYGNWAFNVASLWRLGARARLDFFPNIEMASGELFGGRILIASIRFGEGELGGAPIGTTSGHLVLITGIRKEKNGACRVLVNDPAASALQEVPRHYDLAEFEKAWTGVAYVVEGRR